ncbi:MAG: hypothetical protein ACI9HI_001692, partial [Salinirussus sp.]
SASPVVTVGALAVVAGVAVAAVLLLG